MFEWGRGEWSLSGIAGALEKVAGSCYTLDVNPTSANRVKVRLYETRPVEVGGNILLVQGQLSVRQFEALEELFRAGARGRGAEVVRAGRYYALPRMEKGCGPASDVSSSGVRQRVPGIRGPIIGPNGVVEDDDDDDYAQLALRHVQRMLRRKAGSGLES